MQNEMKRKICALPTKKNANSQYNGLENLYHKLLLLDLNSLCTMFTQRVNVASTSTILPPSSSSALMYRQAYNACSCYLICSLLHFFENFLSFVGRFLLLLIFPSLSLKLWFFSRFSFVSVERLVIIPPSTNSTMKEKKHFFRHWHWTRMHRNSGTITASVIAVWYRYTAVFTAYGICRLFVLFTARGTPHCNLSMCNERKNEKERKRNTQKEKYTTQTHASERFFLEMHTACDHWNAIRKNVALKSHCSFV